MCKRKVWKALCIATVATGMCAGAAWVFYPSSVCKMAAKAEHHIHRADVKLHLNSYVQQNKANLLQANGAYQDANRSDYWIAHGGGIGAFVYCNSKEAVLDALQRGFRYIELDLHFTTDGELVAAHDWVRLRQIIGDAGAADTPMSKSEIMRFKENWRQTPLFAEDIRQLMQDYPNMVLVTDKCQDFKRLSKELPYQQRMIVEASGCYNCLQAMRNGFFNVALSAWSANDLRLARRYKLPGVVLSAKCFEDEQETEALAQELHKEGCCIMVHWASVCDQPAFIRKHLGVSISRIYTDAWSPSNSPLSSH